MRKQQYTSAETSLNQVPALHRWYAARRRMSMLGAPVVVDLGAGKYDAAGEEIRDAGVQYAAYDPYNRPADENARTMHTLSVQDCDVLCANVLNVIAEREHREGVMRVASRCTGTAYFSVYQGDGSGEGRATTKGWQNNRKLASYVGELEQYFDHVERKGMVLVCWN